MFRRLETFPKAYFVWTLISLAMIALFGTISVITDGAIIADPIYPMSFIGYYLIVCFHIGRTAKRKGRNPVTFGLLALLMTPLIPGLVLGVMKDEVQKQ